ncbi:MAG: formylglycine-generating enzyme family protein [Aquihabitans sp.]
MVPIPGGVLQMGSEAFYPEERPVHEIAVGPFAIDRHPVTHAQFAEFVAATGYVTMAERPLDPADFPGAPLDVLVPGGLVFTPPPGPVRLDDWTQWWAYVPGASWRTPSGPDVDLGPIDDHPVTQVAFEDASAYAEWRGVRLPTEAEWELAARGGLVGAEFAWGDDPYPDGEQVANTWQGSFPWENTALDGFVGTSPVGTFPPNGHGLYDVAGNVWEWTTDWWQDRHDPEPVRACCGPTVDRRAGSIAPGETQPRRVIKGGSHLCAPNYCLRFRPAARSPEAVDTATCHIGFRCARD